MTYVSKKGIFNPRGIAVTGAAHIVLAWMALNLAGVAPDLKIAVPPIVTDLIPATDDLKDPPKPVEPQFTEDNVDVDIYIPQIDVAPDLPTPRPDMTTTTVADNGPLPPITPGGGGTVIADPVPPPPVVEPASLDRRFMKNFQPPYPLIAAKRGWEGTVRVEVTVLPNGRARDAVVVTSSGHRALDEAALEHAERSWRFVPSTRDGTPVESRLQVSVSFELRG